MSLAVFLSFALAVQPRLEGGATGFTFNTVFTDGSQNVARNFATNGWLNVFLTRNWGVRLMGGSSWYSSLGFTAQNLPSITRPEVIPTWHGMLGGVYRLYFPKARVVWLDFEASAGVMGASMSLSQEQWALAFASIGPQGAGRLGITLWVQLEQHIAFTLGIQGSMFGGSSNTIAQCNATDLAALAGAEANKEKFSSVKVSRDCEKDTFTSLPAGSAATAYDLVKRGEWKFSGFVGILVGVAVF